MRVCTKKDLPKVLDLLERDIPNAVYMYIDLAKYGLEHPHIQAWLEDDGMEITAILMRYFDTMQVYSLPRANLENFAYTIQEKKTQRIFGPVYTLEQINLDIYDEYTYSTGWVIEYEKYKRVPSNIPIVPASNEELAECAKLICSDPELGGGMDVDILTKQLLERREDGSGRNYVMHKDGKIIAHNGTYAEFKNIAVAAGFIVRPEYRNSFCPLAMESFIVNTLLDEKLRVFGFLRDERRKNVIRSMGNPKCYPCAKLIRKIID